MKAHLTIFLTSSTHFISSSDLWVAAVVPSSNDTGASTTVQYAIGAVSGPIKTAPLSFLDFNVPDQAFSKSAVILVTTHHRHASQFRSMPLILILRVEASLDSAQMSDQISMALSRKTLGETPSSTAFSARM